MKRLGSISVATLLLLTVQYLTSVALAYKLTTTIISSTPQVQYYGSCSSQTSDFTFRIVIGQNSLSLNQMMVWINTWNGTVWIRPAPFIVPFPYNLDLETYPATCCIDSTGRYAWVGVQTVPPMSPQTIYCFTRPFDVWGASSSGNIIPAGGVVWAQYPTNLICQSPSRVIVSGETSTMIYHSFYSFATSPIVFSTWLTVVLPYNSGWSSFPNIPELSRGGGYFFYQDSNATIQRLSMADFTTATEIRIPTGSVVLSIASANAGNTLVYTVLANPSVSYVAQAYYTEYNATNGTFALAMPITMDWGDAHPEARTFVLASMCESGLGIMMTSPGLPANPTLSLVAFLARATNTSDFVVMDTVPPYSTQSYMGISATSRYMLSQDGNSAFVIGEDATIAGGTFEYSITQIGVCQAYFAPTSPPVSAPVAAPVLAPVSPPSVTAPSSAPTASPVPTPSSPVPSTPSPSPSPATPATPTPSPAPSTPVPSGSPSTVTPAAPLTPSSVNPYDLQTATIQGLVAGAINSVATVFILQLYTQVQSLESRLAGRVA